MGETHEQSQSCTPAVPTAESTSEEWPKTLAEPQPCSWQPWQPRTAVTPCSSPACSPWHPLHLPAPHSPGQVTGSDATCLELLILRDQAEPCPARWAHPPHVPCAHHRAQQTCEATSTAAWSLPPPRCPSGPSAGPLSAQEPEAALPGRGSGSLTHRPSRRRSGPPGPPRPPGRSGCLWRQGPAETAGCAGRKDGAGQPHPFGSPFFVL